MDVGPGPEAIARDPFTGSPPSRTTPAEPVSKTLPGSPSREKRWTRPVPPEASPIAILPSERKAREASSQPALARTATIRPVPASKSERLLPRSHAMTLPP
jgi:hypothetical protein